MCHSPSGFPPESNGRTATSSPTPSGPTRLTLRARLTRHDRQRGAVELVAGRPADRVQAPRRRLDRALGRHRARAADGLAERHQQHAAVLERRRAPDRLPLQPGARAGERRRHLGDGHAERDARGTSRSVVRAGDERYPSFSPDGTKVLFRGDLDEITGNGDEEIYVAAADGSGVTQLTHNTVEDSSPNWSPDGTRIALQVNVDGVNQEIYVMNADGTNPVRLTNNALFDIGPTWSPDGRMIAFTRAPDARRAGGRLGDERRRHRPAAAHEHGRDRGVAGLAAAPALARGAPSRGPRAATCRSSRVASRRSSPSASAASVRCGWPRAGRTVAEPARSTARGRRTRSIRSASSASSTRRGAAATAPTSGSRSCSAIPLRATRSAGSRGRGAAERAGRARGARRGRRAPARRGELAGLGVAHPRRRDAELHALLLGRAPGVLVLVDVLLREGVDVLIGALVGRAPRCP